MKWMRGVWLVAVGVLLPGGCAHGRQEPEVRKGADPVQMRVRRIVGTDTQVVRVRPVSVDSVTLAVPTDSAGPGPGECAQPVTIDGDRVLRLRWPDDNGGGRRSVSVTLDSAGDVVSYSDARGSSLDRQPVDASAPGTIIMLAFGRRQALVMNRGGKDAGSFVVPFGDALRSSRLDRPRERIREILRRCRGDAGAR